MSLQDKLASIMERPGQDPSAKEDVPWWLKYAGRGVGTVGSGIAIFLGLWNCVSILLINVSCLISGMLQMVAGFLVLCLEAPCCCMFVDHVQKVSDWMDRRPYWNKAAAYITISLPPIILCFGFSSVFGSGLIFTTGILYGMMSLGRKASAEDMRQAAVVESGLHTTSQDTTNMRANLVANAQPIGFVGTPVYDSNV